MAGVAQAGSRRKTRPGNGGVRPRGGVPASQVRQRLQEMKSSRPAEGKGKGWQAEACPTVEIWDYIRQDDPDATDRVESEFAPGARRQRLARGPDHASCRRLSVFPQAVFGQEGRGLSDR